MRLAAWPGLSRVTTLDLRNNELTPAAVEALCASPHLGNLTTLRLSINGILDAARDEGTWQEIYDETLGKSGTEATQPPVDPCS